MILSLIPSYAQTSWPADLYGRTQTRLGKIKKGTDIHITNILWYKKGDKEATALCRDYDHFELSTDLSRLIPSFDRKFHGQIKFNCITTQDVWNALTINNILDRITEKGYQYNLRQEMEMKSRRYEKLLRDNGLTYDDPQLMLYLQRIYKRIRPAYLPDARTFHYDLMIIQSPAADAYMLPDGTMILTTGMITTCHTQDELAAIMIRETTHLILDHALSNYHSNHIKQIILGAVTTLVTDVINSFTGFSMSSSTNYYSSGTVSTSDISLVDGIMTATVNDMGLAYTNEQEEICDLTAKQILETSGFDSNALPTILERLTDILQNDRRYVRTLKKYQTGDLNERIKIAGIPQQSYSSKEYEKAIASVVTTQAQIFYNEHRFITAENLSRQNINNGIYTDDDCIILASSILAIHDNEDAAIEALSLTHKAQELKPENIQTYKPMILSMIRLNKTEETDSVLTEYEKKLDIFLKNKDNIRNTEWWGPLYLYTESEKNWIKRTRTEISTIQ